MGFIKRQSIHERLVGDNSIILTSDGDVEINPKGGDVRIIGDVSVTGNISGPEVTDVLYVNQDGNDENDGRSMGPDGAKRTIKAAVAVAQPGTTILVAPGDYYEDNPISMPDFVTISGTGELRNTRVWPNNNTLDFFYMGNGCYLYQLTFRGLRYPGWCVKIRPGTLCTVSPYVQNCTNMNGPWLNDGTEFVPFETVQIEGIEPGARPLLLSDNPAIPFGKQVNDTGGGSGMLVDGDEYNPASLVKSFVADAFTQIAQGGRGFEVTNFGYTQIVSCFTVFCSTGFKTTKGGYLSISNSVSDFGTYGVVADGFYPTSYTSAVPTQDYYSSVASVTITSPGSGYTSAPLVSIDAPTGAGGVQATASAIIDTTTGQLAGVTILTNGSGYETVPQISFSGGGATIQAAARINLQTNSVIQIGSLRDKPQVGSIIQFQGNDTYYYITLAEQVIPPFYYDEEVCRRDLRFIIDAVMGDIVMGTNYQSLAAGRAYLRSTSAKVLNDQLEATIYGINSARDEMIAVSANAAVDTLITEKFAVITQFLDRQDSVAAPDVVYNDLSSIDVGVRRAKDNIVANRDFVIDEVINYIREQFTELSYHRPNFDTEVDRLIRAIGSYVALGSEYLVVQQAREYTYRTNLKQLLIDGFRNVQETITAITEVQASSTALDRVNEGFNIWVNVLDEGDSQDIRFDYPDHAGVDANRRDAKDQLQANREFLGAEFIAYLEEEHPLFVQTWDSDDGERYLKGFESIVDALSYDIMYDCNVATVFEGFEYFDDFNISSLSAVDTASLADAFARMREVIQKVVREQIVTATLGNTKLQNFDNPAATTIEAERLDALLFNIEDMITEQTTTRLPIKTYPNTDAEAQPLQDAYLEIIDNIVAAQNSANALIRNNYPNYSYNEEKCKRDVEYIVKAVYRDAQNGTNHNSITAAQAYDRANVAYLNTEQKPATILALREAKRLSVAAVTLDSYIAEQVGNRWDDVLNYLEYDQLPSEGRVFESPGPASQALIDATDTLIANRDFLAEETTSYINNVYDNGSGTLFVYDSDKCSRDTGLIIDAIGYDVAFGTNYNAVTAGLAYQRANSSYVLSDQNTETIGAINYIKSEAATYLAADATSVSRSNAAVNEIIDIIQNGVVSTDTAADALTFPIPTGAAATITAARDRLQGNRDFLIKDVSRFIVNNYPSFLTFDSSKCQRDTGLILDAVGMDIALGTNYNAVYHGIAYTRANAYVVIDDQRTETAGGITYAKGLVAALTNVAGDATALSRSNAAFDEILDILNNGAQSTAEPGDGTVDALSFPAPSSLPTADADDAALQLQQNRTFIQSEIDAWLNNNYNVLWTGLTAAQKAQCRRDTGYIVDALTYDILYGGNSASRRAAEAYYVGTSSQLGTGTEAATAAAYAHLASVVSDIAQANLITKSAGNGETQDNSTHPAATATEGTALDGLVQIIEDVITAGNISGLPAETLPSVTWANAALQSARSDIVTNRADTIEQTIDYILDTYNSLTTFDIVKCERDTGYVIDALTYDIVYGGNTASRLAAESYWEGATTQVPGEQVETAAGFNHLQGLIEDILLGNGITAQYANIETQDTSGSNASATEIADVEALVQIFEDVVEFGTDTLPNVEYPDVTWPAAGIISARQNLLNNKSTLQSDTINYINTTYNGFSYNIEKCQSDTKKVLDALTHDLLYTGNIAMLLATTSYYLGAVEYLPDSQAQTTADAWEHLKGVIQDVIQGVVVTPSTGNTESQVLTGAYGGAPESSTVGTLMDILIDTIQRQADGATTPLLGTPSEIEPNFSWLSITQQNAANQLLNAMVTIQSGTIDYIYNNLVEFTYNTDKCARDTGYIIDAAVYDMMYGGNKQTRRAGLAYYGSTILNSANNFGTADQTDVTAFTYYHLGNVLKEVAQNNAITPSTGVTETQDTSIPDGSLAAGELIELLVDRIGQAVDEGYTTGWGQIDHDYTLGNATYNVERRAVLNATDDIVDAAIFDLNATYGGTYNITVSPGLITVQEDTLAALYNVSTISTSGHAFEYVGAGISYNALPFFGGSPIAENEIIQTDQGKVFAGGTVDQIGNFRVGDFFSVNALTGAITLNANQIDLSGLTSIGPLVRDNIPVGVELKEISNNPNLTASNGTADGNTAPTQYAVVNYVENRYLNKLTGGTITGDVILDGDFDIQGDVLSTDVTGTFNLLNTSATTIEAFGAATTINIGAATGLVTINPDLLVEGTLTVNGNIVFDGDVQITIPDESLQAYSITEGTEDYISINTREHEEKVTFGEQPKVEIRNDSESTSTTTGALVVDGGVGIRKNVYVGGLFEVDGNVRLGSDRVEDSIDINGITDIDIPDNTDAAVRIHENISDYFVIDTTDGSEVVEIGSTPIVTILNLTNATDATSGALQVTGGISSQRNIHAGVDITADQDIIADRDMQVNGTNITTDETGTFNVFNTNATTINAFGDATSVNIGAATGTLTIANELTVFDSVEAIQVPVGTDLERPTAAVGQIRFNTDSNAYEGYDGLQWGVLGGLKDVDQNTFIRPETSPGANNDQLEFFTGGGLRATLDAYGLTLEDGVDVWIKDDRESDSKEEGALRVNGGVGIQKNLHVGGWIGGDTDGVLQLTRYATDKLDIRANEVLAQDGLKIIMDAPDSAADDIVYPMTFAHHTQTGSPVIGSGTGVKFELETSGSNFETGAQIDVIAQDVTSAQEDFDVVVSSMTAGVVTEKFRLSESTATITTSLQVNQNLDVTGIADAAGFRGSLFGDDSTEIVDAINSRLTITNADVGTLTLTTDLEVQYGGTGVSTFTENGILYGDTANPVQVTDAAGTSDASESFQILTVTGAADSTPVWTDTIDGGSF